MVFIEVLLDEQTCIYSIHDGHADVQNDHCVVVNRPTRDILNRLLAIYNCLYMVKVRLEAPLECLEQEQVIVGQQAIVARVC